MTSVNTNSIWLRCVRQQVNLRQERDNVVDMVHTVHVLHLTKIHQLHMNLYDHALYALLRDQHQTNWYC